MPCEVPTCQSGSILMLIHTPMVQPRSILGFGFFPKETNMWTGGAGDQTISEKPATPPAPQQLYFDAKPLHVGTFEQRIETQDMKYKVLIINLSASNRRVFFVISLIIYIRCSPDFCFSVITLYNHSCSRSMVVLPWMRSFRSPSSP